MNDARPWLPMMLGLLLLTNIAKADDRPASVEEGQRLLKEGDRLADEKKPTEAVIRYKFAFEQLLPGLRKLPFHSEVKRDVTAREELKNVLLKELDQDQTPAEFKTGELALKAFGMVERDVDWKSLLVKVYSEEIAAFYDPKTKTMHLIREPEVADKKPTFLERLLGKTSGFDKDENKTVIAHELTHALADQNYDLDAMQEKVKKDDDQSLALSALIEGEATLAMIGSQMDDWAGTKIVDVPSRDLDRLFSLMMPLMPMAGGASLREAPPILAESLIFPYLRGLVFCASLTNRGGWEAVDKAYKQPPQSTEQILHAEKYAEKPDPPTQIDLGQLSAGEGWTEVGRNVLGEFQIGVMLKKFGAKSSAIGWDGDRFAIFEGPDGQIGLVWATTWDTEADARRFAQSYARYQTIRMGKDQPPLDVFPDTIRRTRDRKSFSVDRKGLDVVVVEGFAPDASDRLISTAFRSTKVELPPIK